MWTYLVVKCHYVCKLLSRASTTNECGGGAGEREGEEDQYGKA